MIPALSFTRPWDELVLRGLKPIENRRWSTPHRGRFLVHSALSWDDFALTTAWAIGDSTGNPPRLSVDRKHYPTGYRGVVTLDAICSDRAGDSLLGCDCGPWAFNGQHHWQISDARQFPQPVPGRGTLGLRLPPPEVRAALRVALRAVGVNVVQVAAP